jgi:hypothetical protein
MTAVGIDSVGYEVYYHRASWQLGLSLMREGLLGRIQKDRAKTTYRKYSKRSDVKRTMAVRRYSKIIEELKKEHEDFLKGKTYATNISGPGEEQTGGGGVIASDECPTWSSQTTVLPVTFVCPFSVKWDEKKIKIIKLHYFSLLFRIRFRKKYVFGNE